MFTIPSTTSHIWVYFDIEHGGMDAKLDITSVWADINWNGVPDYRSKNLDTLRKQTNKARQNSLERIVVSETVALSDVWPPETYRELEKQNPTSHQIIAEKSRNTSEILTHIYTRLISHFEQQFSHEDATTHAANFMRKYSPEFQQLLALNTEPSVIREKIRTYTQEYLQSVPLSGAERCLDGSPKASIELFSDEDREFNSKIVLYSLTLTAIWQYEEEHHVSPEEVIAETLSENHLNSVVIPEGDREKVLESAQIDSPASIVSWVWIWDSTKVQMLDENGISDVMCTHTQDGDYILQFPTGESILIDANGDRELAKKEIEFIQEIAKTPIARRLLMNGNDRFQDFRRKFEKQFPWIDMDTHPNFFIKKVLERILSKMPDDWLTGIQKAFKDQLASMLSPEASLSHIQEFLRNTRDQFIPMLHDSGLIPRDGVQSLNTEKLIN